MISILQFVGLAFVLLAGCAAAVGLALAVILVPLHAIERFQRRRAPRSERSRAARDDHAAAVRRYCVISPDYALAVSLLHEAEVTDLLGLAARLRENDRQDDEEDNCADL